MEEKTQTIRIRKSDFKKILGTAETLLDEIEEALSTEQIIEKRIEDIESGRTEGKTEQELDEYLKKRGVKID